MRHKLKWLWLVPCLWMMTWSMPPLVQKIVALNDSPPQAFVFTTTTSTTTTLPPTTTTTTTLPPTTIPPTTQPPPPPPPPVTQAPRPVASAGDDSVWYRLAECESGGNWSINTGNGYYGGLQFSLSSWRAVGGTGYPHEASVGTQIEMGRRLQEIQGWGAWPGCSRQLGLR